MYSNPISARVADTESTLHVGLDGTSNTDVVHLIWRFLTMGIPQNGLFPLVSLQPSTKEESLWESIWLSVPGTPGGMVPQTPTAAFAPSRGGGVAGSRF